MRLVVAGLLRIIAAFCIAIAVLLSGITIIAVALALLDPSNVAVSPGQMILMWLVFVAFLLAVARLATLAVRQLGGHGHGLGRVGTSIGGSGTPPERKSE